MGCRRARPGLWRFDDALAPGRTLECIHYKWYHFIQRKRHTHSQILMRHFGFSSAFLRFSSVWSPGAGGPPVSLAKGYLVKPYIH